MGLGIREFNDNTKLDMLHSIAKDHTFGKVRKLAELSSYPITDLSVKEKPRKKIDYDTYIPQQSF